MTAVLTGSVLLFSACSFPGAGGTESNSNTETSTTYQESRFHENSYGYVDESLDVSGGIPDDAEGRLAVIKERGYLTVATEPYFAPQEFIDPNLEGQEQYVGSDMELARLIAERMGVELRIVPLDFSEVLTSVTSGTNDLIISGLAFTPARAGTMEMSKGYHFSGETVNTAILIREEDVETIKSEKDLAERNLGAQSGSIQESMMSDNVPKYRQFIRYNSMQEVYDALQSGTIDAAAADLETARIYLQNNPDCGITILDGVGYTLEEQYLGDRIAGPKGELMLMYFVNGVIDEVLEDGTYRAWFEEYTDYAARLGL